MPDSRVTKIKNKIADDQAKGAQRDLIEQLFNDHYKNRFKIYQVNFIRGIFFGFGSILGATVVVSIAIWILSSFTELPNAIIEQIQDIQQQKIDQ